MVGLIVLVVVVAVVVGLYLQRRGHPELGGGTSGEVDGAFSNATPGERGLAADLGRWVDAGLIAAAQAEAIAAHERAAASGPPRAVAGERRISLLAEALGYVGVALAVAGAGVGLGQAWGSVPVWARLLIPAAASTVLLVGGLLLRHQQEPAFRRLMSVLWVLAVGGLAAALVILGVDVLEWSAEFIAVMAGAGSTLLAGVLYLLRRHGLQQAVLLAALHVLILSGLAALPGERNPGWWFAAGVWGLGAAWAGLGWRRILEPPWLAVGFGLVGMVIGPSVGLGEYEWLLAPALVTAAGLVALSVPTRQTPLLALGMVGGFGYITWGVVHYFKDSLGVPLALVIVGGIFLVLAVVAGRLTQETRKRPASLREGDAA
jgi:hypothetical protein